jgi:hypothetical protein
MHAGSSGQVVRRLRVGLQHKGRARFFDRPLVA